MKDDSRVISVSFTQMVNLFNFLLNLLDLRFLPRSNYIHQILVYLVVLLDSTHIRQHQIVLQVAFRCIQHQRFVLD